MLVRVALAAATVLVGFLGGVRLHQVVMSPDAPQAIDRAIDPSAHGSDEQTEPTEVVFEDCPPLAMSPPYPENRNGMTYGSGATIDERDPGPDLIAAYGTNGRCGFVRAADRKRERPRTPEEAAADMATVDPGGHDIPLYARDGVTVIGSFSIAPGRSLTSGAPEPSRSTP